MLGKQAIIEFFDRNNIRNIFHLPGIHTLPLNDVFSKQSNINVFTGRHESNIIFMADGYARTSGAVGVVIVTPGPGLGNVVSGCMEAYSNDIPLLIIHIDTERDQAGRGILHELTEPENIFRHFTKKIYLAEDAGQILPILTEAHRSALHGRRGPVLVSIPYTLFEKNDTGNSSPSNLSHFRNAGMTEVDDAVKISQKIGDLEKVIREKKRPLIIGGKGLMREDIRQTLEGICINASIPFLTTTGGKGILREDSPFTFGNVMRKGFARDMIESSDLVIAIGTRLRDVDAKRRGVRIKELVHIDIDNLWIEKNYPVRLGITGDLKEILSGLDRILQGRKFEWNLSQLKELQSAEEAALLKRSPAYSLIRLLREDIPGDTTVVCDLNIPSYWAEYYLPVYHQNTFLMPRGISPIFYSLPASIGAKIGRPDRPCLALCGDGGILPAIGEIATIKRYNIPVVIFVYNNNSFGILEDVMTDRYNQRGTMALNNPDFTKLAKSFGIKAKRTKTLNGLHRILLQDIRWDEPYLIEFMQPVSPPPWRA